MLFGIAVGVPGFAIPVQMPKKPQLTFALGFFQ